MTKPSAAMQKIAELETRVAHLEVIARAAISLVELFQAFQANKHETTEDTHAG